MLQQITKITMVAVFALGLTACGKSENVTALETLLSKTEASIDGCSTNKKGADAAKCINTALSNASAKWSKSVTKASADDSEATAELSRKYAALGKKATELINSAFR